MAVRPVDVLMAVAGVAARVMVAVVRVMSAAARVMAAPVMVAEDAPAMAAEALAAAVGAACGWALPVWALSAAPEAAGSGTHTSVDGSAFAIRARSGKVDAAGPLATDLEGRPLTAEYSPDEG